MKTPPLSGGVFIYSFIGGVSSLGGISSLEVGSEGGGIVFGFSASAFPSASFSPSTLMGLRSRGGAAGAGARSGACRSACAGGGVMGV